MKQRFVLYTIGIAFLLTTTGCSAMIAAYYDSAALDDPPVPLGVSGQEVEKKIGKPLSSRALPDGGRVATYEYLARNPDWQNGAAVLGLLSAATLGIAEPGNTFMAYVILEENRRTVSFTYAPDDRLLEHGPPPSYGAADDALGRLLRSDLRERCRSEHPGEGRETSGGDAKQVLFPDFAYRNCVVRRFAIWGIE